MSDREQNFGRIGVLMGGVSSEREISLKSGRAIVHALTGLGKDVVGIDLTTGAEDAIMDVIRKAGIDIAFIALHGKLGEDGVIQEVLDKAGLPYTGSGAEASRRAFDKAVAQRLFRKNGFPTPEFMILKESAVEDLAGISSQIGYPAVVKPACEGSSIGITIVPGEEDLGGALKEAWRYGPTALVEEYIKGREMTVGIVGTEAMPVVEIRPVTKFFDFEAKYTAGKTEYVVPAKVPDAKAGELQKVALEAHRLLGCEGFSRVDFMCDADLGCHILEVNTVPGFTATSLLPKAAAHEGINFQQLCWKILELGYGKKEKENKTHASQI